MEQRWLIDKKIEKFTVGKDREYDLVLAKYDIKASIAHAKMLNKVGVLKSNELKLLEYELNQIKQEIMDGKFEIENKFEDVHSKIESILTNKLGEIGKKIHTGRSRNDQVLLDSIIFKR